MLHSNILVHVENVVSLFSSPSTSSQKVRKCGGHIFLSQAAHAQFYHVTVRRMTKNFVQLCQSIDWSHVREVKVQLVTLLLM